MTGELFHVGFIYVLTISISVEINGKQIKLKMKKKVVQVIFFCSKRSSELWWKLRLDVCVGVCSGNWKY